LAPFASARVERRWERVADVGANMTALEADPLHRLRIDIKKLRYAAEFTDALWEDERKAPFLAALEEVQERLGDLNDAHVARELVAGLGLESEDAQAYAETLIGREPDRADVLGRAAAAFEQLQASAGYWR
jgi:CHAD domain-containing protein